MRPGQMQSLPSDAAELTPAVNEVDPLEAAKACRVYTKMQRDGSAYLHTTIGHDGPLPPPSSVRGFWKVAS